MFGIFQLRMYYPRAMRVLNIIIILLKYGFANWFSSHTFTFWLVPKRYKRHGMVLPLPERLRSVIEELGPTFIKFGQILADRPDAISDKLRDELKKLQSHAEPFDDEHARELVEQELGGSIHKFFEEFNPKAKFQDYKTKIVLSEIEKNLFVELSKYGFEKENITISNFGNYYYFIWIN